MKKTIIFSALAALLLTSCSQVITEVEPDTHLYGVTLGQADGGEIKYSMDVPGECGSQSTTGMQNISVTEFCGPDLLLLTFSEAPSDAGSDKILTAEETYIKFKEELAGDSIAIDATNPDRKVESFSYADGSIAYLYPLKVGEGEVAMWTYKGQNFALVDQGRKHLSDGLFVKIYQGFKGVE